MRAFTLYSFIILLSIGCRQTTEDATVATTNNGEGQFLELGIMCGTVQFSDGCSPQIDSLIQFSLALVHHMTYDDAEYNFDKVIKMDPDCFWGHWGKALTYIHPIWPDQPSKNQMNMGLVLIQRALSLAQNEKEIRYGKALAAYYENGKNKTERERLLSYERGWQSAHEADPDDLEAQLFFGLSRLSTVSPSDKSFTVQKEVGAMAEKALEIIPDHPAGFHYAIHAYDYPPLANHAVRIARNYSKIAPEIPHALHMPTHIFTRLGYWDESIEGNLKSAAAAEKMPVDGQISLHYLHALDYLVYAHLQKSENAKAEMILEEVQNLDSPIQASSVSAYALAAMPSRMALENRDWQKASEVTLLYNSTFPWEKFPQFSALIYFANGVGAGRKGNLQDAQMALGILDSLHNSMGNAPAKAYWAQQVKIKQTAVEAWVEYAKGNLDGAIAAMKRAALLEDSTEKSPVTPGELLPMREMLGDLLLEKGDAISALDNYNRSLERNPNRLNTLFGAGSAAETANNKEEAIAHFESLVALTSDAPTKNDQIRYAENYIEKLSTGQKTE